MGFGPRDISFINAKDKGDVRNLTVAMVPTLVRNLQKYDPNDVEMVVVDEAHHATATSYQKILLYFKVYEEKKLILGFTATPVRGDAKALSPIFHSHCFKMTLSEATQNGYICPVNGIRIDVDRQLDRIDQVSGDYDVKQLDNVMNVYEINDLIADKIWKIRRFPAIAFCVSVDHAQKVAKHLRGKGIRAAHISYKIPKKIIEKTLKWLRSGKVQVITNAVKLSEGFDFPEIQSVILARPTRSPVLYKQMIGRGLRRSDKKYDCLVLEFCGYDEKMIAWDDIDENATFQCSSKEQKQTQQEAKQREANRYTGKYVKVLDVRETVLNYYECKVRRIKKFKKFFFFSPFTEGFIVSKMIKKKHSCGVNKSFSHYIRLCFWSDKPGSFYVWNQDYLYGENSDFGADDIPLQLKIYMDKQPTGSMGQWYPPEEEPQTAEQRHIIKNIMKKEPDRKMSARKTEMFIEDYTIKCIIEKFMLEEKTPMDSVLNVWDD